MDASVVFMARIQLTNLAEDALPRDFLMRLPPPTLSHHPVRNNYFSFSHDVEHGFNSFNTLMTDFLLDGAFLLQVDDGCRWIVSSAYSIG